MARRAKQVKLDSPTARKRLAARHGVYWNTVSQCCCLGYRRADNSKAGSWYMKYQSLKSSGWQRAVETVGAADDLMAADGLTSFSYEQARAKAVEWFTLAAQQATGGVSRRKGYTVADACEDYLRSQRMNSLYANRTKSTVDANIVPHLGTAMVEKLKRARIEEWMTTLAENRRRIPSNGVEPGTEEALRRSKDTVNRVLRVLKAALNYALNEGKVSCSGMAWRSVKQFRNVGQNRTRFLSDTEARNFVSTCPTPFRNLVRAALYSGARYGELLRLRVCDFESVSGTLFIAQSKSGKPRRVFLDAESIKFFADVCGSRTAHAPMFSPEGETWGHMQTHRMMVAAAKAASIDPLTFHELRHSAASRWARQGLSLAEIAQQLGHADTRMTLRYAHLCQDTLANKIRAMRPMRIYTKTPKPRKAALTVEIAKPQTNAIQ
jgi:integrase